MSARQEPADPETDDLRRVVEGVPGVVSAEVDIDESGRPTIKVHLDGTDAEGSVLEAVRGVVASWRRSDPIAPPLARARRTGLGKGLDSLLGETMQPVAQSPPALPQLGPAALARVSLVRGEHGASVQATDTLGTLAVVFVADGDIDAATVAVVATLRDVVTPRVLAIEVGMIGGHPVATVVAETVSGDVLAGSAPVGRDRLLAVGLAAWRALES